MYLGLQKDFGTNVASVSPIFVQGLHQLTQDRLRFRLMGDGDTWTPVARGLTLSLRSGRPPRIHPT